MKSLGHDLYKRVASKLFKVPESEVTPEMRNEAKARSFSVIYMGVSVDEEIMNIINELLPPQIPTNLRSSLSLEEQGKLRATLKDAYNKYLGQFRNSMEQ